MVLVSMGNFVVRPFPATHPIWALTIVNLIQHRGFNYFSICTHKHKKLDIMWETRYMPPPVLILWLANWKQWFSFYWSFWRLLYLCLFTGPQSKPSFTLFEGSISSKVMCTHHSSWWIFSWNTKPSRVRAFLLKIDSSTHATNVEWQNHISWVEILHINTITSPQITRINQLLQRDLYGWWIHTSMQHGSIRGWLPIL